MAKTGMTKMGLIILAILILLIAGTFFWFDSPLIAAQGQGRGEATSPQIVKSISARAAELWQRFLIYLKPVSEKTITFLASLKDTGGEFIHKRRVIIKEGFEKEKQEMGDDLIKIKDFLQQKVWQKIRGE
jgi:hypothetical protein